MKSRGFFAYLCKKCKISLKNYLRLYVPDNLIRWGGDKLSGHFPELIAFFIQNVIFRSYPVIQQTAVGITDYKTRVPQQRNGSCYIPQLKVADIGQGSGP